MKLHCQFKYYSIILDRDWDFRHVLSIKVVCLPVLTESPHVQINIGKTFWQFKAAFDVSFSLLFSITFLPVIWGQVQNERMDLLLCVSLFPQFYLPRIWVLIKLKAPIAGWFYKRRFKALIFYPDTIFKRLKKRLWYTSSSWDICIKVW